MHAILIWFLSKFFTSKMTKKSLLFNKNDRKSLFFNTNESSDKNFKIDQRINWSTGTF